MAETRNLAKALMQRSESASSMDEGSEAAFVMIHDDSKEKVAQKVRTLFEVKRAVVIN